MKLVADNTDDQCRIDCLVRAIEIVLDVACLTECRSDDEQQAMLTVARMLRQNGVEGALVSKVRDTREPELA